MKREQLKEMRYFFAVTTAQSPANVVGIYNTRAKAVLATQKFGKEDIFGDKLIIVQQLIDIDIDEEKEYLVKDKSGTIA